MSNQQHFPDASSDYDKKGIYESSRTDSGFISGEISEEISESGIIEEYKQQNNTDSIPEEDEKLAEPRSMLLDSGVCLSESFSRISLKEKESLGLNDLNDPKKQQTPVGAVTKTTKTKFIEEIPWQSYYSQDEAGNTHLHVAIAHDFLDVALCLIRCAPDPAFLDVPNEYNQTPMHLASERGQWRIVRWLRIAGARPCPRGPEGDSPLHIAARRNDPRTVRALVEPVQAQEQDQLGLSYSGQMYQTCNFDQWNFLGQTCVHIAAMDGHLEVLRQLIWYDANINARDGCMGCTPLHYAVQMEREEIVNFLLGCKNIDIECLAYNGQDAIEMSISNNIRQALREKGLPSPYSSEDEFDSDDSEDEMTFEVSHVL